MNIKEFTDAIAEAIKNNSNLEAESEDTTLFRNIREIYVINDTISVIMNNGSKTIRIHITQD